MQKLGLVTGCGKGIGLSITKKLLDEKKEDLILGLSRTINKEIESLKNIYSDRFIFNECNILDYKRINNILKINQKKYGSIKFAICNAGIRSRLSLNKSSINLYKSILENNTIANINIAKELINYSTKLGQKCNILFISSIVGSRGFDELSTYAVSKSALEGFMKSAAIEFAQKNIQLNCLAPGFVKSSYAEAFKRDKKDLYDWTISQTPMGRWGTCEEIADLALFLISEKNSFMTGSVIYSDGGWTAK